MSNSEILHHLDLPGFKIFMIEQGWEVRKIPTLSEYEVLRLFSERLQTHCFVYKRKVGNILTVYSPGFTGFAKRFERWRQ